MRTHECSAFTSRCWVALSFGHLGCFSSQSTFTLMISNSFGRSLMHCTAASSCHHAMGDMTTMVNFAACQFAHLAVSSRVLYLQCTGMDGNLSLLLSWVWADNIEWLVIRNASGYRLPPKEPSVATAEFKFVLWSPLWHETPHGFRRFQRSHFLLQVPTPDPSFCVQWVNWGFHFRSSSCWHRVPSCQLSLLPVFNSWLAHTQWAPFLF